MGLWRIWQVIRKCCPKSTLSLFFSKLKAPLQETTRTTKPSSPQNWRLKNYKHIEGYFKTLKTCLVVPLVTVPDGFMKQSVILVLISSRSCADTCTFFTSFLRLLLTSIKASLYIFLLVLHGFLYSALYTFHSRRFNYQWRLALLSYERYNSKRILRYFW